MLSTVLVDRSFEGDVWNEGKAINFEPCQRVDFISPTEPLLNGFPFECMSIDSYHRVDHDFLQNRAQKVLWDLTLFFIHYPHNPKKYIY